MENVAARMKSFQKYSPKVQRDICKVMKYDFFDKDRVIIKQGHPPGSFYFILSGTLDIVKRERDETTGQYHENRIMKLNADQVFGELALLDGSPRLASIVCATDAELLSVDRDSYLEILDASAKREAQIKQDIAKSIPFFGTFDVDIKQVAAVGFTKEFVPNHPILIEGEKSDYIYFIIKGTCKSIKTVKFIREIFPSGKVTVRKAHDGKLKPSQTLVTKLLAVQTLEIGSFFGLGNLHSQGKRNTLKEYLQAKHPREEMSTVTCEKVDCFVLSKMDFIRFISDRAVDFLNERHRAMMTYSQVEEAYLKMITWNMRKAEILNDMAARSKKERTKRVVPSIFIGRA
jgi:CRP-like cAMP-binding protein